MKPFGPHQCFMRSGSVNAFHTRSRGASNTREMTKSGLLVVSDLFAIITRALVCAIRLFRR